MPILGIFAEEFHSAKIHIFLELLRNISISSLSVMTTALRTMQDYGKARVEFEEEEDCLVAKGCAVRPANISFGVAPKGVQKGVGKC